MEQFEHWIKFDAECTKPSQIDTEEKVEELEKAVGDGQKGSEVLVMREDQEEEESEEMPNIFLRNRQQ